MLIRAVGRWNTSTLELDGGTFGVNVLISARTSSATDVSLYPNAQLREMVQGRQHHGATQCRHLALHSASFQWWEWCPASGDHRRRGACLTCDPGSICDRHRNSGRAFPCPDLS